MNNLTDLYFTPSTITPQRCVLAALLIFDSIIVVQGRALRRKACPNLLAAMNTADAVRPKLSSALGFWVYCPWLLTGEIKIAHLS